MPRPPRLLVLSAALALAAGLVPAAGAAPPWSPPVVLDAAPPPRVEANRVDQAALVPRVSTGTAGLALATWPGQPRTSSAPRVLVALDGARTVGARTSAIAAASLRYARTRVLHLDARTVGRQDGLPRVQLAARVGTADLARFGASRAIGGPRTLRGAPVLAVNEAGAAVAAWRHARGGGGVAVQVAVRPAGGRFGAVRTLQDRDVDPEAQVAVGVDAGGRAVVAYARRTVPRAPARLAVRVVDTATGAVAAEARVAPPRGLQGPTELAVGVQPRTRAQPVVVAWRGYPVTEGPTGTIDVAAATLPAGRTAPRPAQALAESDLVAYPRGPITAAVDAAGRPVVAWGQPTGRRTEARSVPLVAQADQEGRFAAPQALDAAGSVGTLAVQDEGLAVGWLRETPGPEGHGAPLAVVVGRRGPDGPVLPGEVVDDRAAVPDGPLVTPADGLQPPGLAPLPSGGLIAVWADVGPNAQGGQARASVRPAG